MINVLKLSRCNWYFPKLIELLQLWRMSVLYSADSGGCRLHQNTSEYASSFKPSRQTQAHHVKMDQANTKSKYSRSNNGHFALLWNWSLRSWAIIQKHAREASLALRFVSVLPEKQLDLKIDSWCEEEMPAYSELPTPMISTQRQTHQRMLAASSRQDRHKIINYYFYVF